MASRPCLYAMRPAAKVTALPIGSRLCARFVPSTSRSAVSGSTFRRASTRWKKLFGGCHDPDSYRVRGRLGLCWRLAADLGSDHMSIVRDNLMTRPGYTPYCG